MSIYYNISIWEYKLSFDSYLVIAHLNFRNCWIQRITNWASILDYGISKIRKHKANWIGLNTMDGDKKTQNSFLEQDGAVRLTGNK